MKALILAAGEGSRMRPLTHNRPKVMLPIANRPILEHLLVEAREAGISQFFLVVGYGEEQVRGYFGAGDRWGVSIEYCTQRKQLGTADAIKMAEGLLGGNFLVMNGDIVVGRADIKRLVDSTDTTMGVFEVADPRELGTVEVDGGRVVNIYEKVPEPTSHLANTGAYLFTPAVFEAIGRTARSIRGEYEITGTLQLMLESGRPVWCCRIGHWLDLSYPWDLLPANEARLACLEPQQQGEIEPNAVIKGPVSVGRDSIVRSGSYIVGPVIIGEGCDIGPNCYIRPATAIGDGCRIGAAVEVKNSIIMRGSKIPHHNYVGDSILGEGCNLGAGTKIANLKLDDREVEVAGVKTGRQKLGAIIGDNVATGINASINTGTVIGSNTRVGPGALAHGVIAPGSKIF
ncbi:MAG: bifunctional sugar-1-phosphate nucleotidylyltransferase/acetyltransferase [Chloroflexota bacterium]